MLRSDQYGENSLGKVEMSEQGGELAETREQVFNSGDFMLS